MLEREIRRLENELDRERIEREREERFKGLHHNTSSHTPSDYICCGVCVCVCV